MEKVTVKYLGYETDIISLNTVVAGSGCAGYNAADSLHNFGCIDIAIVTEGINCGTSRNTGSDKQTYYKLSQGRYDSDSIHKMAKTLFSGGCMHGDIALIEAASSLRNFFKLVNLGVPFPCTVYEEYTGYKTDHDPIKRGISCGPLTSRYMTEKLEQSVCSKGIKIFDGLLIVKIIVSKDENKRSYGLITLDLDMLFKHKQIKPVLFNCTNIVYATGGPGGIYDASVYPLSQTGALGAAFEAGVSGVNLTESQFGIAAVDFRWNLSGTYQQVLPRYVSIGKTGDEKEFLNEYFEDPASLLNAVFLKGYQWPFDPLKIEGYGSSLIDVLVYNEINVKNRKVYMDFTRNPMSKSFSFEMLKEEGRAYLEKSDAFLDTPVLRLEKMNKPAIELFKNNGIDLYKDYLQINVCAQHMNGGLKGNIWWESNVKHFFPVGEACGSFGVYRPGGSALNSTQTGSMRAARYISEKYMQEPLSIEDFLNVSENAFLSFDKIIKAFTGGQYRKGHSVWETRDRIKKRMSSAGGYIREYGSIENAVNEMEEEIENITGKMYIDDISEIADALRNLDIAITCKTVLFAIMEYIKRGGKSRGSYLVYDKAGKLPVEKLPEIFRYSTEKRFTDVIDEIIMKDDRNRSYSSTLEPVRPVPEGDNWFENVWNEYMRNKNIR